MSGETLMGICDKRSSRILGEMDKKVYIININLLEIAFDYNIPPPFALPVLISFNPSVWNGKRQIFQTGLIIRNTSSEKFLKENGEKCRIPTQATAPTKNGTNHHFSTTILTFSTNTMCLHVFVSFKKQFEGQLVLLLSPIIVT